MLEVNHLGNEEELNLILGINMSIPFVTLVLMKSQMEFMSDNCSQEVK